MSARSSVVVRRITREVIEANFTAVPCTTSECPEVLRVEPSSSRWTAEELVVEEPLEIRLRHGADERTISITMRTPGNDLELATGFLLTEAVILDADDIDAAEQLAPGSVRITLAPNALINRPTLERNFYTTSGCGVCGKASLLALETIAPPRHASTFTLRDEQIHQLPHRLRERQGLFAKTGGLHGAALVNRAGELELWREDIGRHNAVDKLIGAAAQQDLLPLRHSALLLSSRVSYDLMQKAVMAGLPMVLAIGAPSSLAVDIARRFNITLVAFLRDDHFNIYSGAQELKARA